MRNVNNWSIVLYAYILLQCNCYSYTYATMSTVQDMDDVPNITELCSMLPYETVVLRPGTCTQWVRCPASPNADFEEGSCVLSMYYNKDTQRCDFEYNVMCPFSDSATQTRNRCANHNDGVYLADEKNCNGYIYCKDGQDLHSTCPGDLVFNPQQSACVYKQDYTCPQSLEPTAINPICRSIPNDTPFANTDYCNKFNKCVNGELRTEECSGAMAFDYRTGRCVLSETAVCHPKSKKPEPISTICGPDNVPHVGIVADPDSCSGYFICARKDNGADRHPQHGNCENGYFFDANTWSCRDRLNVRCTLDRCEGMGNKYVNIAGDCTAYALCKNGVREFEGHCANNYYFDERTQGCTPDIINYVACSS